MMRNCSKALSKTRFAKQLWASSSLLKNYFSVSNNVFLNDPKICSSLKPNDYLVHRHIGPNEVELENMLKTVNAKSLEELLEQVIPREIYDPNGLKYNNFEVPPTKSEHEFTTEFRNLAKKNQIYKNYIGAGYYGTITPPVIQRNLLENPVWYTSYTPYQAEVSQGRLESLLNYQTMISELTGMEYANASLLDEGTASAEAMAMCFSISNQKKNKFFISQNAFPQTIAVVKTKGKYMGIEVVVGDPLTFDFEKEAGNLCGALFQNPDNFGVLHNYQSHFERLKKINIIGVLATDILALTLIKTPKEMGADITVGSSQRFGVPLGYGGPHAAFFATIDEYKRKIPGRIIGVSVDRHQNRALRMAMQTREQHIRREKATSNICTAQALLANIAAMYGIYHGPEGLTRIAKRVNRLAQSLAYYVDLFGYKVSEYSGDLDCTFFDTVTIKMENEQSANKLIQEFLKQKINIRKINSNHVSLSVDETTTLADVAELIKTFANFKNRQINTEEEALFHMNNIRLRKLPSDLVRKSDFMNQEIFNSIHSESQMQRFMHILQNKDISLTKSMISLGSCTMKLNAASEMYPISWPEFNQLHPFAPLDQAQGFQEMIKNLENWLRAVTKFDAFSLQPNSGAHGEYTGLLAIASYHQHRGHGHRNICLIPVSAHGTNPASAVLVGFKVVAVNSDPKGNIDLNDLREKATKYKDNLAAFMVTYPSTHGVYEDTIKKSIAIIHENGGQVYMDGANMNAQVGWTSPGYLGADVCHLNLHKTFAIPHGGGGPGLGPIGVRAHLAPFLPTHPVVDMRNNATHSPGTVTSAPWSSAGILPIPYAYIGQLGKEGLKRATAFAILNANYVCSRLKDHYKVLFTGQNDRVAHEFIMDIRPIKEKCGISEEDIAKRLIDFGFHAPTMSFPVPGTLMIEPTESEDKGELDRFIEAFLKIREEIRNVENGVWDKLDNPLKNAPHTQDVVTASEWKHCYSREQAAFPLPWVKARGKFWPSVGRVDNAYGDRNLVCTCPPMTDYK